MPDRGFSPTGLADEYSSEIARLCGHWLLLQQWQWDCDVVLLLLISPGWAFHFADCVLFMMGGNRRYLEIGGLYVRGVVERPENSYSCALALKLLSLWTCARMNQNQPQIWPDWDFSWVLPQYLGAMRLGSSLRWAAVKLKSKTWTPALRTLNSKYLSYV